MTDLSGVTDFPSQFQPDSPGANNFANLVATLQNMVQGQSQIITLLTNLTGNLAANYSTGTWTPGLAFGGATTGITYNFQNGSYTVLGNLVFIQVYLGLTDVGSATGDATITGLPFTATSSPNVYGGGACTGYADMSSITSGIVPQVTAGTETISLRTNGSTASALLTNSNFTSSSALVINAFYQMA